MNSRTEWWWAATFPGPCPRGHVAGVGEGLMPLLLSWLAILQ